MTPPAVLRGARAAVELLAAQQYDVLERLTGGERLTADEMQAAIEEYGQTVIELPAELTRGECDVIQVAAADRPTYHVAVDLYTKEEGRSDLTLELEMVEVATGLWDTHVLDIHVM